MKDNRQGNDSSVILEIDNNNSSGYKQIYGINQAQLDKNDPNNNNNSSNKRSYTPTPRIEKCQQITREGIPWLVAALLTVGVLCIETFIKNSEKDVNFDNYIGDFIIVGVSSFITLGTRALADYCFEKRGCIKQRYTFWANQNENQEALSRNKNQEAPGCNRFQFARRAIPWVVAIILSFIVFETERSLRRYNENSIDFDNYIPDFVIVGASCFIALCVRALTDYCFQKCGWKKKSFIEEEMDLINYESSSDSEIDSKTDSSSNPQRSYNTFKNHLRSN